MLHVAAAQTKLHDVAVVTAKCLRHSRLGVYQDVHSPVRAALVRPAVRLDHLHYMAAYPFGRAHRQELELATVPEVRGVIDWNVGRIRERVVLEHVSVEDGAALALTDI